ncbi:MAG TPA: FecR domain-containing protein [Phycisphaerales bacterium]|nr:FecR domain-containing protein [Phycisphaerales bacterium]
MVFATRRLVAAVAGALAIVLPCAAAQPPTRTPATPATPARSLPEASSAPAQPGSSQPPASELIAVVVRVSGNVTYKPSDEAPAAPVTVGLRLPMGARLRTGVKSIVQLQIGAGQLLTIDRLSNVKLAQLVNLGGVETTRVELPTGRLEFNITSTRAAGDVKIQAPDATLAVKGTIGGIDVAPGFPTRAYGDVANTGTFLVTYPGGVTAVVSQDQATDASSPDPAQHEAELAAVDTGDVASRDPDESAVAARAPGSADPVALSLDLSPGATSDAALAGTGGVKLPPGLGATPGPGDGGDDPGDVAPEPEPGPTDPPIPSGPGFFGLDLAQNRVVFQQSTAAAPLTILQPLPPQGTNVFAGLALRTNPANGRRELLLMDSVFPQDPEGPITRTRLRGFDPDNPAGPSADYGFLDHQSLIVTGLAALGTSAFASGIDLLDGSAGRVWELTPGSASLLGVMNLEGAELDALAASPGTGTVFAAGSFQHFDDPDPESVLLELDPRANYLVSAWRGGARDFEVTPDTANAVPGLELANITDISGLALVDGRVIYAAQVELADENVVQVLIEYNPRATGGPGDPRLVRIDATPPGVFLTGLAGSAEHVLPRPPPALSLPVGPVDPRLEPVFGQLAYSQQALGSGMVERLVSHHILENARDPAGCSDSGALFLLPGILARHVHQHAGVGQSLHDFHADLPPGHPCAPFE